MSGLRGIAVGVFFALLLAGPHAHAGPMNGDRVVVGGQIHAAENGNHPWSLTIAGNPPCLYRFEVRPGDRWVFESPKQPAPVERSELQGPGDETDPARFDAKTWTAYQFKLEPGGTSTAQWAVLGDWHVRPDPGDTATMTSPWQLELLRGDILAFITSTTTEKPARSTIPFQYLWKSAGPITRGVWHSLVSVADFDWRPKGEGGITLWLDGAKIVDYRGPLGYNNAKPPYFKFGIYRAATADTLAVDYANVETSRAPLRRRIHTPPPICSSR